MRFYTGPEIRRLEGLDPNVTGDETCEVALIRAFNAVPESDKTTRAVLRAILMQKGCEEFELSVEDGKLTTLMDVIIFG